MAAIDISSAGGGGSVSTGVLQLQNGVAMDSTLRSVADQNNTTSPLKLSTTAVQVLSPLRITTSDASGFYIDAEDSATNNRFSVKRDPSSQLVTIDFASNPTGSTTAVGAIRTYVDGVNLSEVMTFREDGNVGIGTTSPTAKTHIVGSGSTSATTSLLVKDSVGNNLINLRDDGNCSFFDASKTGQLSIEGGALSGIYAKAYNSQSDNIIRYKDYNGNQCMTLTMTGSGTGNLTVNNGATSLNATVGIKGSGSTSATTSLLVQNSAGTAAMTIKDDLTTTFGSTINANYINMQFTGIYNSEYFTLASGDGSLGSSGLFVGSGGISSSAILQANSTTKGFLPPRMTDAQRAAISSPAEGLLIYNTDNHAVAYRDGTNWGYLCGALQNVTGAGGTQNILFASGNIVNLTLTASTTLTFSGHVVGTYIIKVIQGGTGSYTLTYPASVIWSGGTAPTLSTAVGKVDILTFFHDGTSFYGTYSLNY